MLRSSSFNKVLIGLTGLMISVSSFAQVTVAPGAPITKNRKKAQLIYSRITGESAHIDDQILIDMELKLDQNDDLGAAALATAQPEFYNNTLRFFGQSMTTKAPSYKAPFTDFVATILGVTKDNIDARELLTADYLYRFNSGTVPLAANQLSTAAIYQSNTHYAAIQAAIERNSHIDIRPQMVQVRQQVLNNANALVNHPEPAGVMTSRAFMELCASGGTNRRCYEETMKKFMCTPIEQIADTSVPDDMVGKDVSRVPGGDPAVFQKACRGCHGNMDSQRAAFAFLEFDNNQIKHGKSFANGPLFDNQTRVALKMNRQAPNDGFTNAYVVADNAFVNYMPMSGAGQYFEWRDANGGRLTSSIQGAGVTNYGRMVANSAGFSNCLVRKAFATVCRREVSQTEATVVRSIASEFENAGKGDHKLKWLFERVVTDAACTGK